MTCDLCTAPGGEVLWQDGRCRIVLVDEPGYPGFCRVIWHEHVAEMTDLDEAARAHLMRVVFGVERALRAELAPDKVNLASIGNFVPHLHWHVIPRYRNDAHFPHTVWGERQRDERAPPRDGLAQRLRDALDRALSAH